MSEQLTVLNSNISSWDHLGQTSNLFLCNYVFCAVKVMVFGTSSVLLMDLSLFSSHPHSLVWNSLKKRSFFAIFLKLCFSYLYFAFEKLGWSWKSPAFKPYPDLLVCGLGTVSTESFFLPHPLANNTFQRGKRSIGILLPLLHRSFSISVPFIRWEINLFMERIRKELLFSFSIAKSDSFISSFAVFDPLFGSSFRVYVTNSFHFKEKFSSLPLLKKTSKP